MNTSLKSKWKPKSNRSFIISSFQKIINKIYKFLISLKIAVILILVIGLLSAIGTILEAQYDTKIAQTLVYHSPFMFGTLAILCLTLFLVMVDRWPWKKHHLGFVLAHIGIIILLLGSYITYNWGVDGSLYFENGQKTNRVTLPDNILSVYASFGNNYTELFKQSVNFIKDKPTEKKPFDIDLGSEKIKVLDYWHFSLRESKFEESNDKKLPPAIRFQIFGSRANSTQWIGLSEKRKVAQAALGPLVVVMVKEGELPPHFKDQLPQGNQILFTVLKNNKIQYEIYSKSKNKYLKSGMAELGDAISTGFMDFNIRLLNFYPHYKEKVTYKDNKHPNNFTQPAILVDFNGEKKWMGKNTVLKLFSHDKAYVVTLTDRVFNLDFSITLKEFIMGRYQGTMQASSYASQVIVNDTPQKEVLISMNEPLKHKGFTFYQASFEQDEMGRPKASILSVNRDPGRALKYLGSLLIVLGSIYLFYFKKLRRKKKNVS